MIHFQSEAARRAALSDDDMLALSASSESGYSLEVVQAFLDALEEPTSPTRQRPAPRVVYVGTEIDKIVRRNPAVFGRRED